MVIYFKSIWSSEEESKNLTGSKLNVDDHVFVADVVWNGFIRPKFDSLQGYKRSYPQQFLGLPNLLFNFYLSSCTDAKRPEFDYDHYIIFNAEEKLHITLL
jgi:hypothetical protein